MEGKKIKIVYFIYQQKGEQNNTPKIESNDKIKNVKEISKKGGYGSIIILYRIEVLKNEKENRINISILDNGKVYVSHILFDYLESLSKEGFDMKENIIFKLKFNTFNNEGNCLNKLPNSEQFYFFAEQFKENQNILINLYLCTISQIFLNSNEKFDFILKFFLIIYDKNKLHHLFKTSYSIFF